MKAVEERLNGRVMYSGGAPMVHMSEIGDYVAHKVGPISHIPMVTATLPPMPKTATAAPLSEKKVPPAPRDQYGNIEWSRVKLPYARVSESQEDEMDQAQAWADKNHPAVVEDEQEPLTNWARRLNHGGRVNSVLLDKLRPLYLAAGGERIDE